MWQIHFRSKSSASSALAREMRIFQMTSKAKQPVSEAQEGQNYMYPPLFFFSFWPLKRFNEERSLLKKRAEVAVMEGGREKSERESTKCRHWRGLSQLNRSDTDFALPKTITPARTAWDFTKCFWTRIPDSSALHNSCCLNAGNRQPTERRSQKQCAQLLAFFKKKKIWTKH